ncbi:competence transcription factor [Weizmannia acidilactici]|uniref:Competence transcription factor n=1 Tax=Weizmannia acidilactici TaxID=2607726 RepID=A0A5J4J7F5_9BACI|nr:competence protein ComK [Weizmannia acidilactici]GER65772.1 competence transcription factor [Weizmannia acidilactici]GER70856.1 competence transcription factor [Weizmannia acidilactici]GER72676.1 competence transcription factor [Weizmannia acidilactici]
MQLKEYEICPYTMAIIPYSDGSEAGSKVLEVNQEIYVQDSPLEIVKISCENFGSNFEGRKNSTKRLINVRHKPPIIIDPHTSTILFPTKSPTKPDCIWLVSRHIKDHYPEEGGKTKIIFSNNQTFILPISHGSFLNQYHNAASLQVAYEAKIRRARLLFLKQQGFKVFEDFGDHGLYWF